VTALAFAIVCVEGEIHALFAEGHGDGNAVMGAWRQAGNMVQWSAR
jgi:hypothetical protein